jgi:hypothetical protein
VPLDPRAVVIPPVDVLPPRRVHIDAYARGTKIAVVPHHAGLLATYRDGETRGREQTEGFASLVRIGERITLSGLTLERSKSTPRGS